MQSLQLTLDVVDVIVAGVVVVVVVVGGFVVVVIVADFVVFCFPSA